MLDDLDALVALETFGTITEAATRLRLTQSAVSKRIAALQANVAFPLLQRDGRRVRLTARAVDFLDRARPLVAELRALARASRVESRASFSLAMADSIASSWGPAVVRRASSASPKIDLDLHVHRSVLVIESVRLGRYDIGLCTASSATKDLVAHPLIEEPMVVLPPASRRRIDRRAPLLTIEETSATWRAIEPQLRAHHTQLLSMPRISVESFGAVLQMRDAGFGNGLVPLGLAVGSRSRRRPRPLPNVARTIVLLTRKTVSLEPAFVTLHAQLLHATRAHFERVARS